MKALGYSKGNSLTTRGIVNFGGSWSRGLFSLPASLGEIIILYQVLEAVQWVRGSRLGR
jgi:hypothetical protein